MVKWNLQIKIPFILGHIDDDKDGCSIRNSKSNLHLHSFKRFS